MNNKILDEYLVLKTKKDALDSKIEKAKKKVLSFMKSKKIKRLDYKSYRFYFLKEFDLVFPLKNSRKRKELESLLRKKGVFKKVSQIDTFFLEKMIKNKEFSPYFLGQLKPFVKVKRNELLRVVKRK